ncbi:type I DNA topoisomerase, partial [bacterium]|nr:type I DNA topoisomerase [bacterium]
MKKVIIVESPAKARTIANILKGFEVYSSYGHIRDLPKRSLGVDIKNDFSPRYRLLRQKLPVIKRLKEATKKAEVYLATDFDREGEAIAWHLKEVLNLKDPKRITFHEITPSAIKEALKHPRSILEELVNAQKARRVIDRLFGYKLSPFLWKKILRGLSAGRVQSAALRLIVEREKEIREFKPKDFYRLRALFETDPSFSAYLEKIGKKALKKFAFRKPDKLEAIKKEIQGKPFVVKEVSSSLRLIQPPAPFITATLQQEAFRRLGFSAKQTMFLAQQLYEGVQINSRRVGLITYMRTDSPSLAKEALSAIRGFIEKHFGRKYLPPSPREFRAPKHAQEAHE